MTHVYVQHRHSENVYDKAKIFFLFFIARHIEESEPQKAIFLMFIAFSNTFISK